MDKRLLANIANQRPIVDINITPFTDVILVLLVIFMATMPLILQSNIKENLPTVTDAKSEKIVNQVIVTITKNNGVYLGDKGVTLKDLKAKMATMHSYNPDLTVVLFSDKSVSFEKIVAVLGILNGAGVKDLNIAVNAEVVQKLPNPARVTR